MASVLVFATLERDRLAPSSLEAVTLARSIAEASGQPIIAALTGSGVGEAAQQLARSGVSRLLIVDDTRLAGYTADAQLAAAEAVVRNADADILVAPSGADSIEWAPRLAARLGAGLATNCVNAKMGANGLVATRAIGGGALLGDYSFGTACKMLLVTPGISPPAPLDAPPCPIEAVALPEFAARAELLETIAEATGDGPLLKNARVVVSGGMGIGSADNWPLVEDAARVLGGAVGATRAAVEVGWAPSARQVGFSGLKVSPDLYIAIGISGALHHLAGIGGAKKVVAINNDSDASIFRAAHLGVVGDIKEVMPAFIERVRELRG